MTSTRVARRLFNILFMAFLLIGLLAPLSIVAASEPDLPVAAVQAGDIISSKQDGVNVTAGPRWTVERMNAAQPYPLPEVEADIAATIEAMAAPSGPSGLEPGGLPGGQPLAAMDQASALSFEAFASPSPLGYSYPAPFTRFDIFAIAPYTKWPFVTIGKLFFRQLGKDYVCSAASIGNKGIWTAGHCVHAGNNSSTGWSTNVRFVPAYKDGNTPNGVWTAYVLYTRLPWYQARNFRYDMGGAKLNLNGSGQKISTVVGWLGFAWNWPTQQHWWLIGYPAAIPFNGLRMITCQASLAYLGSPPGSGPQTMGVGCDMTGGTSGGPWVWQFGTGNYLNGDNSYYRTGFPKELFSPYLDSGAKTFKDMVTGN